MDEMIISFNNPISYEKVVKIKDQFCLADPFYFFIWGFYIYLAMCAIILSFAHFVQTCKHQ